MMLANYAESRSDGLLNMLGGGVDTINVTAPLQGPDVPDVFTVMNVHLIFRVEFHATESGRDHDFALAVVDEDGGQIAEMAVQLPVQRNPDTANWPRR